MTIVNARDLHEALAALDAEPGTLMVQGGTDAMVAINFGHLTPRAVLSLRGVRELRGWQRLDDGSIVIGSGLPYAAMETGELAALVPALAQAARTVGSPQIRATGTLGGNLGTCSPAGDTLPVLAALDATVELQSLHATRSVPFTDFMTGPKRSVLQHNELITGVRFTPPTGFQGYAKVGVRNAMVIAVASVCLVTDHDAKRARIALGSVGPTIIRARHAESTIATAMNNASSWQLSPSTIAQASEEAASEARPINDHRSTAAYRRHAIAVLTKRLLERANNE